ncbi:TPA: multidrug DMT transporter permease [Escherichia coli]|nr:multidrug DMT transporter permease [Escherichia coli]HAX5183451.1 multidrug DMT transporter permease [Escherichia coli]HAX5232959.1 multidrug DMT transporter permease [Escherichia coli]
MFEDALNAVNAVRGNISSGRQTADNGTFRNVPFFIIDEQQQTGGRRLVKREYPLRDTGGVTDLGKKLRTRTFSACILDSNADTARDAAEALMEALDAPGSGELVHPDFGTVDVMVDAWECRTRANELNYYTFSITVYPALKDTAPDVEVDSSAAVSAQATTVTGSLCDTLSSAWQTVQDGTAAATAVADAVTAVINDITDTVDSMGITRTVSGLMGSLTALKDAATGLINKPAMLASSLMGALSCVSSLCDTSDAFSTWNRLAQKFSTRNTAVTASAGTVTATYSSQTAEKNIATLNYVMLAAAQTYRAEAASQALTAALETSRQTDNAARVPVLTATTTATGTADGASSTSSTVTQGQLQSTLITPDGDVSSVSSDGGTTTPPVFESMSDIEKITDQLGAALDSVILTASEKGFSTDSVQLTQLRLLVVADLEKRGLQLAGSETHRLPETMPAMVALYRFTGNSRNWQRLARRNGVSNPLFVPGGVSIEVINE